jgi:hypothetical protein
MCLRGKTYRPNGLSFQRASTVKTQVSAPPDTTASSTTKTCRHDIAEISLKVALSTINQIKLLTLLLWI